MAKKLNDSLVSLEKVAEDTSSFLEKITKASEDASRHNSSTLFGVAGGIVGALVGVIVAPYMSIPLLVLSTLLTGLGIVAGILAFRGNDGIVLEKRMYNNRIACKEILDRIKQLPKDVPQEVIDDLWANYRLLNNGYRDQVSALTSPKKTELAGRLLPHLQSEASRIDDET